MSSSGSDIAEEVGDDGSPRQSFESNRAPLAAAVSPTQLAAGVTTAAGGGGASATATTTRSASLSQTPLSQASTSVTVTNTAGSGTLQQLQQQQQQGGVRRSSLGLPSSGVMRSAGGVFAWDSDDAGASGGGGGGFLEESVDEGSEGDVSFRSRRSARRSGRGLTSSLRFQRAVSLLKPYLKPHLKPRFKPHLKPPLKDTLKTSS